ncbi:Rhythmically expressed gene 2 protein [Sergentomyia squamirostris]
MSKLVENLKHFRLVTFDITDTLLRFRTDPALQYAKVASEFGYPNVDPSRLAQNFRVNFREMAEKYPVLGYHHPEEIGGWYNWWHQLVIRTFETSNARIPSKDLDRIAGHLIKAFETSECWERISSADHLVGDIKSAGKTVGVITNSDPRVRTVVKNLQLPEFDFVLCSFDIGHQKPSRKIFDRALEVAGDGIKASESLHVGNTPLLDYVGAREAGWSGVLITNQSDKWMDHSDHIDSTKVYSTLKEFHEALKDQKMKL